jgi:ribonuclease BN (tRNA processing enzyme)
MTTVTLYGTRGSTAYDSLENKLFGGNTACVGVRTKENDIVLLDAGTGLLAAEKDLLGSQVRNLYLALSHPHHDHVEGLAISALPYVRGLNLQLIGSEPAFEGLARRCNDRNFPVPFDSRRMPGINFMAGKVIVPGRYADERSRVVLGPGLTLEALAGNHPGGVLGYRLDTGGKSIVYATDHEFDYASREDGAIAALGEGPKINYRKFIAGADLLIADGQFTKAEYESGKPVDVRGWGHAHPEQVLDLAAEAGVRRVVFTHHAPRRTDEQLLRMEAAAQDYCASRGYALDVAFARQGGRYEV